MRKEQRIEERIFTDVYTYYVANDGTEFTGYNAEEKCREYEKNIVLLKLKEKINHLICHKYDNLTPFPVYSEWRDCDCVWYHINKKEDFELIMKYYEYMDYDVDYISETKIYPDIICIMEFDEYIEGYWLDGILKSIEFFLGELGKEIEIKDIR